MSDHMIPAIDLSDIRFEHDWRVHLRRAKLKILFVTDSRFTDTNSVYEFMDGQRMGCTDFVVHRALYSDAPGGVSVDSSPGPNDPHYTGFQFQSDHPDGGKILDRYHVVFLFAVNSSSSLIGADESAELHRWMDAGGGIFATGDHDTLGQRLASQIPRVGTMRKWTSADGVPPVNGPTRIDTNQPDPTKPGQVNGSEMIPALGAQLDQYPQPITWLPVRSRRVSAFTRVQYPHEILCHPDHGPIDVMPDHPHEGECVAPSTINYSASVKYDDSDDAPKEYPTRSDGHQEKPVIVARGRNASQYWQQKDSTGKLEAKIFDMISVYDGHQHEKGRVVVDSTWHHWYDMNIDGLIAAGGVNWDKVGRYFLNVAKYLSPPGVYRETCWWELLDVQFAYPFLEEVVLTPRDLEVREVGRILHEGLRLSWGECGVTQFVIDNICAVRPALCGLIEREIIPPFDPDRPPHGPVCLTCPPFDLIQATVLGGIVRGTEPLREQLSGVFFHGKKAKGRIDPEVIRKHALAGVAEALDEMVDEIGKDLERSTKAWSDAAGGEPRQSS